MHTPIMSTFRQKPTTRVAWWALGLGLSTIAIFPFLGIFAALISPILHDMIGETFAIVIGFVVGIVVLLLPVFAIIIGVLALRKGERSWVVYLGIFPAFLVSLFLAFMIVAEIVFPH